eukprot:2406397-Pyramimonas_sp.AAC.2
MAPPHLCWHLLPYAALAKVVWDVRRHGSSQTRRSLVTLSSGHDLALSDRFRAVESSCRACPNSEMSIKSSEMSIKNSEMSIKNSEMSIKDVSKIIRGLTLISPTRRISAAKSEEAVPLRQESPAPPEQGNGGRAPDQQ